MNGFTAIELLLVIVFLGIMGLAAVSLFPNTNQLNLSSAAKQVQSDIEYARQHATATEKTSGVVFTHQGSYIVYQDTQATPLSHPLTHQDMIITLDNNYPGTSISGNYTVEFNHMGQPTTGGGGSITLVNGSITKVIMVTANTGRVTIQ